MRKRPRRAAAKQAVGPACHGLREPCMDGGHATLEVGGVARNSNPPGPHDTASRVSGAEVWPDFARRTTRWAEERWSFAGILSLGSGDLYRFVAMGRALGSHGTRATPMVRSMDAGLVALHHSRPSIHRCGPSEVVQRTPDIGKCALGRSPSTYRDGGNSRRGTVADAHRQPHPLQLLGSSVCRSRFATAQSAKGRASAFGTAEPDHDELAGP